MAEALLRHALNAEPEPLRSIKVISAGISAWEGYPCSENSARALKKVGLDLANHRSKLLSRQLLEQSLLVVCMTESHKSAILRSYPDISTPVLLMRELLPPPADPEIPDPYGADLREYEATRDAIVEAVPSLVEYLRNLTSGTESTRKQ